MSAKEDKAKDVATDAAREDDSPSSPGSGKAAPENGAGGFIVLFFIIGLVVSLIAGWLVFPTLLYSRKAQPIDFNHALHVQEVDDGCQSCHYFRDDGSFSGVPGLDTCMTCHEDVLGESAEEEKFFTEYVQQEKEVPWFIYSRQLDCVFFSHVAHVKTGHMDCATCHGPIGESEHSRVYEENRISGISRDIWGKNMIGLKRHTWDRMKMDDCAACHAEAEVPGGKASVQTRKEACFVCHK